MKTSFFMISTFWDFNSSISSFWRLWQLKIEDFYFWRPHILKKIQLKNSAFEDSHYSKQNIFSDMFWHFFDIFWHFFWHIWRTDRYTEPRFFLCFFLFCVLCLFVCLFVFSFVCLFVWLFVYLFCVCACCFHSESTISN